MCQRQSVDDGNVQVAMLNSYNNDKGNASMEILRQVKWITMTLAAKVLQELYLPTSSSMQ